MKIDKEHIFSLLMEKIKATILREKYRADMPQLITTPLVKIITGPRRVGKSHYLYMTIQYLLENKEIDKNQIFYVNKERSEFSGLASHKDLINLFENWGIDTQKPFFVGIDEAQEINGFEKYINDLYSKYPHAILYITGSNSKLLSSKYATLLAGRFVEKRIFPLSIHEFCNFSQKKLNETTLQEYFQYGALPQIPFIQDNNLKTEYLKGVYNTVFTKDIVEFFGLRKSSLLRSIHTYLFKEVGNLFTANNISKYFQSQKISMSINTVVDYLEYSKSAFLFHDLARYDIKGKKILEINSKIYPFDLGIRNAITGYHRLQEREKYLEHIVLSHLLINNREVHIGVLGDKEIDFIANKNGEKLYIQVCYLLTDQKVIEREFGNLMHIQDHYQKIVVSMDASSQSNYDGVQHYSLLDFLERIENR